MYSYKDKQPTVSKSTVIFEGAKVIGDVTLGNQVSVWFNSVLRGDMAKITIGDDTNIQDLVMIHTDTGYETTVGKNCTIGHSVILHGCMIGDNTLIGMGATILNGAKIGRNCIIGANSLVTENKEIPDNHLAFGNPVKVIRPLTESEVKKITENGPHYIELSKSY